MPESPESCTQAPTLPAYVQGKRPCTWSPSILAAVQRDRQGHPRWGDGMGWGWALILGFAEIDSQPRPLTPEDPADPCGPLRS